MSAIDETLAARGEHYGDFKKNFAVIQQIKLALQQGEGWDHMPLERREALEMIAVKMGRLVSGDSGHADSWHDIAGYARLVEAALMPEVAVIAIPAVQLMTGAQIRALLNGGAEKSLRVPPKRPEEKVEVGKYAFEALQRYAAGGFEGMGPHDLWAIGLDGFCIQSVTAADVQAALREMFPYFK